MRSKPKARRLANDEGRAPDVSEHLDDTYESDDPTYGNSPEESHDDDLDDVYSNTDETPEPEVKDELPVYIPDDIPIPEGFQLQESGVYSGLGVWTLCHIEEGEKFGPFGGIQKDSVDDPSSAWELVDSYGKVKGWIDASEPGTGNWMKYVRSTSDPRHQNVMALQTDDQVFYKSIRDISPGEEMLLYERDAVYQERDVDVMTSSATPDDKPFDCERCGDTFRSKVALRRHETYVCHNTHAIYNTINKDFQAAQYMRDENLRRELFPAKYTPQTAPYHEIQPQDDFHDPPPSAQSRMMCSNDENHPREEQDGDLDGQAHSLELRQMFENHRLKEEKMTEADLYGHKSDQSEEMIQTSAADDLSALGSPEHQPYTPLLDTISNSSEGLKTFHCENCDKQFTDPSNLQRHIRSQHVGARSHACPECGKTFATSSGLKQHQHIHSSVKPFQCEVCLKAYTQFSNLCRHKRMHADCRQQIKCKDCGQAFSTMTSLSKHKRFCEGMIRSNGSARIPFSALPATPDKSPSMVSPMHGQSPSALASVYANFYGPRPPFPFYPPLSAAGFPMFPAGHPLASMASHMNTDSRLAVGGVHKVTPLSPGSNSLVGQTGEMKREKNTSEGSEADSSEVSSASDLDTSTGSDGDSEFGLGHRRHEKPMLRAHLNGTVPIINTNTRLSKSPLTAPPAAHNHRTSNHKDSIREEKSSDDDAPFDLSKSSPSTSASSGDQPLDLSVKVKDVATVPQTTPRKTHIFGGEERKRTPSSTCSSNSPETPPPQPEVAPPVEPERKLHYAFSMPNTVVGMDPMYRVDKEKLQSYQDAAARMMAFGPRLPMHSSAVNFGALSGGLGMLSGRPDASKLLPPMLGKVPEQFHYNNSVNKLKERYACKFCGKIFPRSANLTRHLRTHTGEQPYKCKYCERSFSISSNLQRHVRNIHNKEKPFKCPLCDRCFGQQTNLDRHLKKHESDDPNMVDSPLQPEQELEEKDESYFDEIRNFIGKATGEGGNPHNDEHVSMQPEFPRATIDSNFSITAQLEKQSKMAGEKRSAPMDGEDDEGTNQSPKKSRLENNNEEEEEEERKGLGNGYHGDGEDEDADPEEDLDEDEEEGSINDLSDMSRHPSSINNTPLACTS